MLLLLPLKCNGVALAPACSAQWAVHHAGRPFPSLSAPCHLCPCLLAVRDGLSNKLGASGSRLHLRRCQCGKKTPPCK